MAPSSGDLPETLTPTPAETELAQESSRQVAKLLGALRESVRLQIRPDGARPETLAIPSSAVRLLADILTQMAKGNAVTVVPVPAELTTQQAADLLDVSRPYLIDLLVKGVIPFRKVGTHRRVLLEDLLAYKQKTDRDRLKALEELSALDQELGLGY
jgi:excisionase family DNA binding protein